MFKQILILAFVFSISLSFAQKSVSDYFQSLDTIVNNTDTSLIKEISGIKNLLESDIKDLNKFTKDNELLRQENLSLKGKLEKFTIDKLESEDMHVLYYGIFGATVLLLFIFLILYIGQKRKVKYLRTETKQVKDTLREIGEVKKSSSKVIADYKASYSKEKNLHEQTKKRLNNELEHLNKKLTIANKSFSKVQSELSSCRNELNKRNEKQNFEIDSMVEQVNQTNAELLSFEEQNNQLRAELTLLNEKLEAGENELNEKRVAYEKMSGQIDFLESKIEEKDQEIEKMILRVSEKMMPESRLKLDDIEINILKLEKIKRLNELGAISETEFQELKDKILNGF